MPRTWQDTNQTDVLLFKNEQLFVCYIHEEKQYGAGEFSSVQGIISSHFLLFHVQHIIATPDKCLTLGESYYETY